MSMLPRLFMSAAIFFQSIVARFMWIVSKASRGVPGVSCEVLSVFILSSVCPLDCQSGAKCRVVASLGDSPAEHTHVRNAEVFVVSFPMIDYICMPFYSQC